MVFFYTSKSHPEAVIYMGKDKTENEELIEYAFPRDVWFHVDDYSSAHVYLRLENLESLECIPQDLFDEMCQLTKANSIEGSKKHAVDVVYTFADNLLKRTGMAEGQVGFKIESQRKIAKNVNKDREIYNALKKSKREEFPDLRQMHIDHMIIWETKQHHKELEKKWEEEKKFKEIEEQKRKEEEEKR